VGFRTTYRPQKISHIPDLSGMASYLQKFKRAEEHKPGKMREVVFKISLIGIGLFATLLVLAIGMLWLRVWIPGLAW
jgi:hypothetical protein